MKDIVCLPSYEKENIQISQPEVQEILEPKQKSPIEEKKDSPRPRLLSLKKYESNLELPNASMMFTTPARKQSECELKEKRESLIIKGSP